MSAQGLESIDHTVHLTHEWINELTERLGWASKRSAWRLMRVVFHRIRDHLLIDEVAQFSAQLPLLVRGAFFEGWVPKHTPLKERHSGDFIGAIDLLMADVEEYRGVKDIACVFALINHRISEGEVTDVRQCLPTDLRALWP